MLSAKTIVLEYVCPILGAITSNQMFGAPTFAVQKAIAKGSLGDLNPLPWAFQMGNTVGWVVYSIIITNYFVFAANLPGFFLSCWFNLAASKLQYRRQYVQINQTSPEEEVSHTSADESRPRGTNGGDAPSSSSSSSSSSATTYKAPSHDYWTMGMIVFWSALICLVSFADRFSHRTKRLIIGVTVNMNLVFFYGAPLSTIATVLSTRNSATLHVPTMLTNTANSVFWTAYGAAILDYFILVPNGLGAILGGIQIFLYMTFPRNKSDDGDQGKSDHGTSRDSREQGNENMGAAAGNENADATPGNENDDATPGNENDDKADKA